jgi:hypothetical protein
MTLSVYVRQKEKGKRQKTTQKAKGKRQKAKQLNRKSKRQKKRPRSAAKGKGFSRVGASALIRALISLRI